MAYGIYDGKVIKITKVTGVMVHFMAGDETGYAPKEQVAEIDEKLYLEVEAELVAAGREVEAIKERMYRLEEEFRKKTEALRILYMETRSKEVSIINRLLKSKTNVQQSNEVVEVNNG
jgi:hypothetical protein